MVAPVPAARRHDDDRVRVPRRGRCEITPRLGRVDGLDDRLQGAFRAARRRAHGRPSGRVSGATRSVPAAPRRPRPRDRRTPARSPRRRARPRRQRSRRGRPRRCAEPSARAAGPRASTGIHAPSSTTSASSSSSRSPAKPPPWASSTTRSPSRLTHAVHDERAPVAITRQSDDVEGNSGPRDDGARRASRRRTRAASDRRSRSRARRGGRWRARRRRIRGTRAGGRLGRGRHDDRDGRRRSAPSPARGSNGRAARRRPTPSRSCRRCS